MAFQRPTYTCFRVAHAIVIDGELDDPSWQGAPPIGLVRADDGSAPRQPTEVRVLWDDDYLYVAFSCQDEDIWGTTTERDRDIYNQEVVEVFVDPDRDDHTYIEIEVSPLNAILDLFMLNRNDRPRGLWGWDSEGLLSAVKVDGDPTRRGTRDRSWTVEMAIPMSDFYTAPNLPPRAGDVWHMNLYRIDRAEWGDEYTAWSPPGRLNYHTPGRFGRLLFSGEAV